MVARIRCRPGRTSRGPAARPARSSAPAPTRRGTDRPLAAGTTSNLAGRTATLNGNDTADGGSNTGQAGTVSNAGIISSGFVYALTSANTAPGIGGTGVTKVGAATASSLPVATDSGVGAFAAAISGLPQGTSYTFRAYAQDISGYGYSVPVAFTTPTLPTVTTPTATSVTGVSANRGRQRDEQRRRDPRSARRRVGVSDVTTNTV